MGLYSKIRINFRNNDGMPLDILYTTYNSINAAKDKKEKNKQDENFTVQMEVNIAKINKPANAKINLNQTNIISRPIISSSPKKETNIKFNNQPIVEKKEEPKNIVNYS